MRVSDFFCLLQPRNERRQRPAPVEGDNGVGAAGEEGVERPLGREDRGAGSVFTYWILDVHDSLEGGFH
jgi:hypothetical protein